MLKLVIKTVLLVILMVLAQVVLKGNIWTKMVSVHTATTQFVQLAKIMLLIVKNSVIVTVQSVITQVIADLVI